MATPEDHPRRRPVLSRLAGFVRRAKQRQLSEAEVAARQKPAGNCDPVLVDAHLLEPDEPPMPAAKITHVEDEVQPDPERPPEGREAWEEWRQRPGAEEAEEILASDDPDERVRRAAADPDLIRDRNRPGK